MIPAMMAIKRNHRDDRVMAELYSLSGFTLHSVSSAILQPKLANLVQIL